MKKIAAILAFMMLCILAFGQKDFSGIARLDRTTYDFGSLAEGSGPAQCSYKLTNISSKPIAITSVISSCGCTDVKWTRSDIAPGESGTINATYKNEDGPYPFDKTLTVYVSGIKKPIILHLKGIVRKSGESLAKSFPVKYGSLALRSREIKAGNMQQGEYATGEISFLNTGKETLELKFKDVSPGLSLSVEPQKVKSGQTGKIRFSVAAAKGVYGKAWHYATPIVNGKVYRSSGQSTESKAIAGAGAVVADPNPALASGCTKIGFWSITKENFTSWSKDQKNKAAIADFTESTYVYKGVKVGDKINASFSFTNTGASPLVLYKVESESNSVKSISAPAKLESGKKGEIKCSIDTSGLQKGENLFILNIYTNSPSNPVIYLYVTGIIR